MTTSDSGPWEDRTPYRVLLGFNGDPARYEPEVHELGYYGLDDYPRQLTIEPAEFEPLVGFAFSDEEAVREWARATFRTYRIIDIYGIAKGLDAGA